MSHTYTQLKFGDVVNATDYVANGSFESLRLNVSTSTSPGHAVVVRLVDHNAKWTGPFSYVDKPSYDFLKKSRLIPGDVVVSNVGANAGTVFRVPDLGMPMTLGPNAIVCHPLNSDQIDRGYLYYYLSGPTGQALIAGIISGSAQPKFNKTSFRQLPIALPNIREQQAIAELLGALDDKIAANTNLAALSEDLITAQYQRAINSEETVSQPLFSVIDFDFGEAFKGSEFSESGVGRPLIRIRDLKTFTSQVWTTEKRLREILVQPGDVVVGMDAEFRPTVWLGQPGLLNQRVCRARGKFAGPAFVREALKEPLGRIEGYKSATTVIHLNKKDLEEAEILVPSFHSLALFESSVEALYSQRVSLAIENRTLTATRDALLPQLMSGKLRIKVAEKVLEEAGV